MKKPLLIIIGVLGILFGLASFGLYKQIQANGELSVKIKSKDAEIEAKQDLIEKERSMAIEVSLRAQKYYEDKQNDQTELDGLRACVADKSCGVRVVKGACPAVSGTNSAARGNETTHATDRRQFEQDYISLLDSIKVTKRRFEWMQTELVARSAPDYCKPK